MLVWSKETEDFFILQYPLTKIAVWSIEAETFYPHYPLDKRGRFERKKMKKALGNFPKAVEKFILLCYNTAILQRMMCKGDAIMSFQAELKRIRQRCFLSQQAFAKEINVAFSTVNRWESGKTKPNLTAMKSIKEFCSRNDVDYASLEELWLDLGSEGKQHG